MNFIQAGANSTRGLANQHRKVIYIFGVHVSLFGASVFAPQRRLHHLYKILLYLIFCDYFNINEDIQKLQSDLENHGAEHIFYFVQVVHFVTIAQNLNVYCGSLRPLWCNRLDTILNFLNPTAINFSGEVVNWVGLARSLTCLAHKIIGLGQPNSGLS